MKTARALSFGNLSDYEQISDYHFKHSPDKPIHRPNQSLLTTTSGFTNFRGLLNWGAFLLLITTSRMALENILKYGIVINPSSWLLFILQSHGKYFALILLLCTNLFICAAWLTERAVIRKLIGNRTASFFLWWNLFCILAFPTGLILSNDFNPLFSAPVLMVYTILFLKLWSYGDVNRWCRQAQMLRKSIGVQRFITEALEAHKRENDQSKSTNVGDKISFTLDETGSTGNSIKQDVVFSESNSLNHSKIQGRTETIQNESTVEDEVRKRQRSPSPTGFQLLSETKKSPLVGMQTSASAKPLTRQRGIDKDRLRFTRYSVTGTDQCDSLLDALDHELHGLHHIGGNNDFHINRYIAYPQNVTLTNLYYFILAPTLCYELNFPRTLFIRKSFLLRRLFEVIFLSQLMLCLTQQWMIPTLKNSVAPIAESNISQILERCLKLAIPNHLIWLLFFYSSFHSFLNLIGELMHFGDRFFYSDWWNAESVPAFWSKWNIPVHRFARRHIYLPLVECGLTRPQAGMVVFFISAVLHEFLISVPLKMPRMWAFLCMFGQMPYAQLVRRLFPHGGSWGNLAVWITLIIGQPLAMLFYFHDYYLAHYVT